MLLRAALLLPLLAVTAAAAPPARAPAAARHVVIITVDGLRPDAIDAADAHNLAALRNQGAAAQGARALEPTATLPNHISMATGLMPATHGVLSNKNLPAEIAWPTVFTVVHDAGLATALYFGKSKLVAIAPRGSAAFRHGPATGTAVAARFAEEFPREHFVLSWVHLLEPDMAGHDDGWMSKAYFAAVLEADAAVGEIVRVVDASGLPTTILLTSDHGGDGQEHFAATEANRLVPWMCRGTGVRPGTTLPVTVSAVDIAPTALAILGLPPLPQMEGQVVAGCVPPRPSAGNRPRRRRNAGDELPVARSDAEGRRQPQ